MQRFALLLLLACFAALAAGCGSPEETSIVEQAKKRGSLRIATEPTFRPFESVDENDELVGFDIDLARVLAADLGVKAEFVTVDWNSIIPTLLSRKADLIMSGMTITEERKRTVDYSDPYFHTITCLLLSSKKAPDVKGVAERVLAGEEDARLVYRKRLRRRLDEYERNVPPHVQAARLCEQRGLPAPRRGGPRCRGDRR